MSGNNTIASLLVPLQQRPLLLPTACVVEVLEYSRPTKKASDHPWLLGETRWRGQEIPVISFELLNQRKFAEFSATNRIMIVRRTTEECEIPFYAMVIQGLPQPLELSKDDIKPSQEDVGTAEKMQVTFKNVPVALPDLGLVEESLSKALLSTEA